MRRALEEVIQCIESKYYYDSNSILFRIKSTKADKGYEAVYRVRISEQKIECSCKDFANQGNKYFCKHILNIIYKRMRYVPWKHFPETSELFITAKNAHILSASLIPRGKPSPKLSQTPPAQKPVTKLPEESKSTPAAPETSYSECQICCESMKGTTNVSCPTCEQNCHKSCFATWEQYHKRCPYCNGAMSIL